MNIKISLLVLFFSVCTTMQAQDYATNQQITARVKALKGSDGLEVQTQSLTQTVGNQDIWAITIGKGEWQNKPAIAIVGGVDGRLLLSRELALGFAEKLIQNAKSDSISNLLDQHTFFVFPDMSPDASAQYHANLKYARHLNARATDLDRDGKTSEDSYDDLNKDGVITMMRVEDASGSWRVSELDERLMVKADLSKGEKGTHRVFSEGLDNDRDALFNEDTEGGVAFNMNLSYQHPTFSLGAGDFAVSEKETRALLDFLYEQPNIYSLFIFGPDDNLLEPIKFNKGGLSQRVITSLYEEDAQMNTYFSDAYKKQTGLKDGLSQKSSGGDFLNWAYFHFGRYAYSTPGWFIPKVTLAKDTVELKGKDINHQHPELRYLRWAENEGLQDIFVNWSTVDHPDFKGKNVEVGGLKPHQLENPPYAMVDSITQTHAEFILMMAEKAPLIELINVTTEEVGKLTRVKVTVHNTGTFATQSKLGDRVKWVKELVAEAEPAKNQSIISGDKKQILERLEADGSIELEWLIQGKGDFRIKVGSSLNGFQSINVKL